MSIVNPVSPTMHVVLIRVWRTQIYFLALDYGTQGRKVQLYLSPLPAWPVKTKNQVISSSGTFKSIYSAGVVLVLYFLY